jgi:multimeric flavodoxin WrbA
MKILGISASRRKWGNTDILVHHVLQGAAGEGAETRFLRLTDFDILQCQGCLSCLFKDRDCVIEDDFRNLLAALREADGVVLGSPVYALFAVGSLQKLVPRLFRQAYTRELAGKPGVALTVAGIHGWEGFSPAQVSTFFLFVGMPLIDQIVGHAQGPGEIFYDTEACERAAASGRAMARGDTAFRGKSGICPVCHCDIVITRRDGSAMCLLCELPGRWVEKGETKQFNPLPDARSRWEPEEVRRHFEEKILPSGKKFLARRDEIRQKLDAFRLACKGGS